MKVVDNFGTFPKRINIPSYDQRFRSYDHCKFWDDAGNQFWANHAICTSLDFKATSKGNMREL
jgi:hypothetical protein